MSLGMHGLIANIYDFSSFNLIVSFNRVPNTPEVKMETGTVKWFNQNKGFGFIERENEDKDLFVHMTEVQGQINDGDKVEFDVGETEKGPAAQKVKKVD
jgi:CspA family cold shock protein